MSKNKVFVIFWGVVLNLLPLYVRPYKNYGDVLFAKDQFFFFTAIFSAFLFGFNFNFNKQTVCLLILGLMVWFNQFDMYNVHVVYQSLCIGIAILFTTQTLSLAKADDIYFLLNALCIGALVQSILVLLQTFGIDVYIWVMNLFGGPPVIRLMRSPNGWVATTEAVKIVGSIGNPNHTAAFIAFTIAAFFRKKWVWLLPLPIFGLIKLESTMSIVAAFFVFTSWAIEKFIDKERKKRLIYGLGAVLLIPLAVYSSTIANGAKNVLANNGRFLVWRDSILWTWDKNPIFGFGPGYFSNFFSKVFTHKEIFGSAHNEIVEIFVVWGLVGLVLFGIFFWKGINKKRHIILFPALVGVVFNSIGNFTFHISATAVVGILIFAYQSNFNKDNKDGILSNASK